MSSRLKTPAMMSARSSMDPRLVDGFGRHITYVRLSVTDRCDLRCRYCMDKDATFLQSDRLLSLDELARVGRVFVSLGVHKLRITGGEPLARAGVLGLFRTLGTLPDLRDLTLTTNGTRLARMARPLREAGVHRINISLDSLRSERFLHITRVDAFQRVMAGIDAALAAGFDRVKLNSVILAGQNEDEVVALARFALERGLDISFIEQMPMGATTGLDRARSFFSTDQVLEELSHHFTLVADGHFSTGGPARYYRVSSHPGRIGFISPHSHNFCDTCNRVRVTAEGRLLLCLGQENSVDLRTLLRETSDDAVVAQAIVDAMTAKPQGHEFDLASKPVILRRMNLTGG